MCVKERLIVVFVTESRDIEALVKVGELIDEFGLLFLGLYYIKYVFGVGEVVGKSLNCVWLVRCVKREFVEKRGLASE